MGTHGVIWGANTIENVGYGIRELVIAAVVDEDVLSMDTLLGDITNLHDIISRVDVSLWNKVL